MIGIGTGPLTLRLTIERILFFGVFLGYLYHFHVGWEQWIRRYWVGLLAVALILVSVASVRLDSRFMLTAGFSILYVGFGLMLLLTLSLRNVLPVSIRPLMGWLGNCSGQIGKYSYSTYLWHVPLRTYLVIASTSLFHRHPAPRTIDVLYVPSSLALGIAISLLVEYPVLRVRDRWFPPHYSSPGRSRTRHWGIELGAPSRLPSCGNMAQDG